MIYIIWLAHLFLILAVTADEYFVPCLNWIAKALNLDENIAGVTFVALGNGAPDIFGALGIVLFHKFEIYLKRILKAYGI